MEDKKEMNVSPATEIKVGEIRDGYVLDPNGLAEMVKNNQIQYLRAFGGGEGLAMTLKCDPNKGQKKNANFELAHQQFGANYVEPPTVTPYLILIWEGLHDITLLMLIFAAIVSLVLGLAVPHEGDSAESSAEWIEGIAILVTVAIVLNVQAMTDWLKARQFRKQQLELENSKLVNVIRDGEDLSVHPKELIVGDLIRIEVGDILPADAVMLSGSEVKMDESALTGESTLIPKCPASKALSVLGPEESEPTPEEAHKSAEKEFPFMLSGTNVMSGSGKVLVVAVGENSLQGKILALTSKQQELTSATEHPADATKTVEKAKKGCCASCCSGFAKRVKQFFTFGNIESGGTLMQKLDQLAIDIGKGGIIVATITFIVMCIRFGVDVFTGDDARAWNGADDVSVILEFFITAVTILVVAIPEGLPLAVTLSLAISMRRMTSDQNQVKHMESCETMGSATTICSDKTGTLTENRMTVMQAYISGKVVKHNRETNESVGKILKNFPQEEISTKLVSLLAHAIALNSSSTSNCEEQPGGTWKYEGNATECALLQLAAQAGFAAKSLRTNPAFADPEGKLDWGVFKIPFSSSRKKMTWVVPKIDGSSGFYVFSKGAPSYIFDACTKVIQSDGIATLPFDAEARAKCDDEVRAFQDEAMRTIAIAFREFDSEPAEGWSGPAEMSDGSFLESDLTLIGVVGIEDPLRPTVVNAIEKCNKAGVDVRMCTGDALATAIAISKQCHILRERDLIDGKPKPNFAMTGAEFDERVHFLDETKPKIKRRIFDEKTNDAGEGLRFPFVVDDNGNKVLNQTEFDNIWPKLRVLARCQPEDKLTLVRGLRNSNLFRDQSTCEALKKEHGINIFPDYQVVAVTGDGTNDAPALRSADVGFAMGIVGTDIAKQACDIMLLDDNFASIVKAVMWGRNIYDSIAKFIQFQLTINIVAITSAVIGAFVFTRSPLSAIQMLWVNMIMDSLASIALATEPPTEILLDRPPYGKRRSVISRVMMFNMFIHAAYQLIVIMVILFADPAWLPGNVAVYPPEEGEEEDLRLWSILFNTFVQMNLFNQLNSRKLQTVPRLRETWWEWNVFVGISKNPVFLVVMIIEVVLQALIMQFAGATFRIDPDGLSAAQWGVCLAFGFGSLLVQFLVNAILLATDTYFEKVEQKSVALLHEQDVVNLEKANSTNSSSMARARWHMVRNEVMLSGNYSRPDSIKVDPGDNWVLPGQSRPFRDYVGSREEQIRMESQISMKGRELLGLSDDQSAATRSDQ